MGDFPASHAWLLEGISWKSENSPFKRCNHKISKQFIRLYRIHQSPSSENKTYQSTRGGVVVPPTGSIYLTSPSLRPVRTASDLGPLTHRHRHRPEALTKAKLRSLRNRSLNCVHKVSCGIRVSQSNFKAWWVSDSFCWKAEFLKRYGPWDEI